VISPDIRGLYPADVGAEKILSSHLGLLRLIASWARDAKLERQREILYPKEKV
jgi:hypothetical protein